MCGPQLYGRRSFAAGRACPAPTVQLILKRSNYLCEQSSSASPAQALPLTGEPRAIGPGLVILLGVRDTDDSAIVPAGRKCAHLRILRTKTAS